MVDLVIMRMVSLAIKFLVLPVVGFLFLFHAYIFWAQESFIFFPRSISQRDIKHLAEQKFESFFSEEGEMLGWLRSRKDSKIAVMLFHGNSTKAGAQVEWFVPPLNDLPLDILLIEYPGYSNIEGEPSRESILNSSRKAVESYRLLQPGRKVIFIGESLGGGPASRMAKEFEEEAAGLVLISTFTSISEMSRLEFPFLIFVDWILKHNFNPLQNTKDLKVPLLLIHGTKDETVPHWMSEEIARQYQGPGKLLLIDKIGHGMQIPRYDHESEFWRSLRSFIRSKLEA